MLDMFIVVIGYTIIIGGSTYFVSWVWTKGICLVEQAIEHFIKWCKNTKN